MNIADIAASRYTTKAYDPKRKIAPADWQQLESLLRLAPSSVNSQPWHFIIAEGDEAKARIARATTGPYGGNEAKVLNASHVLVFCTRTELSDEHLQRVLAQEERDGRFPSAEGKVAQQKGRGFYVNLHRETLGDTEQWMEKQLYLALGALLFGAAALAIDSTPIEGYDHALLDEELGLQAKGLRSAVMVALGYRSDEDFNAGLPKSRLPADEVISYL